MHDRANAGQARLDIEQGTGTKYMKQRPHPTLRGSECMRCAGALLRGVDDECLGRNKPHKLPTAAGS